MINWIGPINDLSYGIASSNLIVALMKLGVEVSLFPIGNVQASYKHIEYIKSAIENAKFFSRSAPCVRLWHQFDLAQFVGSPRIGFPIFELDTFTDQEKHHLKSCDQIFVCSKWAKDIVENSIPGSICKIVPLGVDTNIFKPVVNNNPNTVFLNVGKLEKRKGHDLLPMMFHQAFMDDDSVELWMMCDNPFYSQEENLKWKMSYRQVLGNKVKFINRVQTQDELASIIQQADCGIFPHRAEGWGLPILEMMACGKQIITTGYSGNTEFCNYENSHLVIPQHLESAHDDFWFTGQGNWANFGNTQIQEFVKNLQKIHLTKSSGKSIINNEGVETAKQFSWENSAKCILKYLFG